QLCSVPVGFGEQFSNLEFLNLENNQLSSVLMKHSPEGEQGSPEALLEASNGEKCSIDVKYLDKTTDIEEELIERPFVVTERCQMSRLLTLRMGCNQLTQFPEGLC